MYAVSYEGIIPHKKISHDGVHRKDIADGMLSGAVHWWLYANTPCGKPDCEECADIQTAELRMQTLRKLITEMAETSEYYHSPNDTDVARA